MARRKQAYWVFVEWMRVDKRGRHIAPRYTGDVDAMTEWFREPLVKVARKVHVGDITYQPNGDQPIGDRFRVIRIEARIPTDIEQEQETDEYREWEKEMEELGGCFSSEEEC